MGQMTGALYLPCMKKHLYAFLLLMISCNTADNSHPETTSERPQVQLFEPGIISTGMNELNATFSPDGSVMLYTIANNSSSHTFYTIFIAQKQNGEWSKATIAPFSGQFSDADPFFAPDGKGVYFISLRPRAGAGEAQSNFDIWYVGYENNRWLSPQNVGDSVNGDKDELYPAVSRNGNLFFSRETEKGYDILMSSVTSTGYRMATALKGEVNTAAIEYDAYVSPDERYMIFTAIGRDDSKGSGDLYISYNNNGHWSLGENLGDEINSAFMDQCPSMSPDGSTFLFTSFRDNKSFAFQRPVPTDEYFEILESPFNGLGNIFWISSRGIFETATSDSLRTPVSY